MDPSKMAMRISVDPSQDGGADDGPMADDEAMGHLSKALDEYEEACKGGDKAKRDMAFKAAVMLAVPADEGEDDEEGGEPEPAEGGDEEPPEE